MNFTIEFPLLHYPFLQVCGVCEYNEVPLLALLRRPLAEGVCEAHGDFLHECGDGLPLLEGVDGDSAILLKT